jgi:ABC-type glycerol-3-phosphate transport system substrate-binding protein
MKQLKPIAAVATLAVILAITGCGAAPEEPSSDAETGAGTGVEEFLRDAAEPYAGQTIEVLAISSAQAAAMEAISAEFTKLTGINVNVTTVAENELVTRAQVTLSSESAGFDVLQTLSFFVPAYAANDWLIPVSELSSNYPDATYPDLDLSAYVPAAIDQLSYGDEVWSLPMFVATQVMYYQLDMFKENRITPPKTLDEFMEALEEIDSPDMPAFAARAGIGPSQNVYPWTSWLYNTGGRYFDGYDEATGAYSDPVLDSAEAAEAADLYAEALREYGPEGALSWVVSDVTRAFLAGQVAIIQEGSPFGGTINDPAQSAVAGNVGAFAMPTGPAGAYYPSSSQGWGVNRYGDNIEASWLFTQWATDPEVLLHASLESPFPAPPLLTVFENDEFREKYDFPGFLDALETSLSGEAAPVGDSYIPALNDWQSAGQQISVELNRVLNDQEDAAAAMRAANQVLKEAVGE